MPAPRKRRPRQPLPARLPMQLAELAFAVPQVVTHRVARMALAGAQPSARDRREFNLMGAEKAAAFAESWMAMTMGAVAAHQQLVLGLMRSALAPWTVAGDDWTRWAHTVLGQGLAPVHRRAVANAKRLRKTRLR